MYFPVIIIGGGPAGTVCSLHLSQKAVPHLLLESHAHPRDKACADILTSNALREIGKADDMLLSHIQGLNSYREIWGTTIQLEDYPVLDLPYRGMNNDPSVASCVAVRRKDLDHLLWQTAVSKEHCTGLDQNHVQSIEKSNELITLSTRCHKTLTTSTLVIAAGSHSRLITEAGLKKKEAVRHTALGLRAYFQGVEGLVADRCELLLKKESMPGGFYIAPLGDGTCNVNVVVRKDLVKRKELNLHEVMQECYDLDPVLKKRFEKAKIQGSVIGHSLQLATLKRKKYRDAMFLCGDSGGLIDLISANGIPQAMCSGRLAALHISNAISGEIHIDEAGRRYEIELEAEIASEMKLGRVLSPWMGKQWFNNLILGVLQRSQRMGEGHFLQDLLYADEPWKLLKKKLSPF